MKVTLIFKNLDTMQTESKTIEVQKKKYFKALKYWSSKLNVIHSGTKLINVF